MYISLLLVKSHSSGFTFIMDSLIKKQTFSILSRKDSITFKNLPGDIGLIVTATLKREIERECVCVRGREREPMSAFVSEERVCVHVRVCVSVCEVRCKICLL